MRLSLEGEPRRAGTLLEDPHFEGPARVVDGTGEGGVLGTLAEGVALDLALARHLLEEGLVITWWHIGAELELAVVPEGIRVTGEHLYFTNERNVAPIDFLLALDGGSLSARLS